MTTQPTKKHHSVCGFKRMLDHNVKPFIHLKA